MTQHYVLRGTLSLAFGFVIGATLVSVFMPDGILMWIGAGIVSAVVLLSVIDRKDT
jgi:hypothetical protein